VFAENPVGVPATRFRPGRRTTVQEARGRRLSADSLVASPFFPGCSYTGGFEELAGRWPPASAKCPQPWDARLRRCSICNKNRYASAWGRDHAFWGQFLPWPEPVPGQSPSESAPLQHKAPGCETRSLRLPPLVSDGIGSPGVPTVTSPSVNVRCLLAKHRTQASPCSLLFALAGVRGCTEWAVRRGTTTPGAPAGHRNSTLVSY